MKHATLRRLPDFSSTQPIPLVVIAALGAYLFLVMPVAIAQHDSVINTLHNLSVSGPGEIKAVSETQVCKFCHVPHNAVVAEPLWSRAMSVAQYDAPSSRATGIDRPTAQPDGSSRLCLSCHDGTVALGDVTGQERRISMAGATRLHPGRKGFLGTDLSGSHPISFVVPDGDQRYASESLSDLQLRSLAAVTADSEVKLDRNGKMQCTTCHDPHADRFYQEGRVPRFWVKSSVDEVCLTCHALR